MQQTIIKIPKKLNQAEINRAEEILSLVFNVKVSPSPESDNKKITSETNYPKNFLYDEKTKSYHLKPKQSPSGTIRFGNLRRIKK